MSNDKRQRNALQSMSQTLVCAHPPSLSYMICPVLVQCVPTPLANIERFNNTACSQILVRKCKQKHVRCLHPPKIFCTWTTFKTLVLIDREAQMMQWWRDNLVSSQWKANPSMDPHNQAPLESCRAQFTNMPGEESLAAREWNSWSPCYPPRRVIVGSSAGFHVDGACGKAWLISLR